MKPKYYKPEYYRKNKKRISKNKQIHYLKHRKKILNKIKKYYYKNSNKILLYKKIYYLNNKFKKRIYDKKYYTLHFSQISKIAKKYYQENKARINKRIYNYTIKKLKSNLNFRILFNLRARVRNAIKNNQKKGTTLKFLGCSVEKLKHHLESQFKKGMSWNNYGTGKNGKGMKQWHIDHIKPCVLFDLSKIKEQYKCFNYKNLRPLWARENLSRKRKIIYKRRNHGRLSKI